MSAADLPIDKHKLPPAHRPFRERIGRRGASLIIYAVLWLLTGAEAYFTVNTGLVLYINIHVWALLFVGSGILALLCALRQTPAADKLGFAGLLLVGTLWVFRCIVVGAIFYATHQRYGDSTALISAIPNALLIAKVYVDAGWSENVHVELPDDTGPPERDAEAGGTEHEH